MTSEEIRVLIPQYLSGQLTSAGEGPLRGAIERERGAAPGDGRASLVVGGTWIAVPRAAECRLAGSFLSEIERYQEWTHPAFNGWIRVVETRSRRAWYGK